MYMKNNLISLTGFWLYYALEGSAMPKFGGLGIRWKTISFLVIMYLCWHLQRQLHSYVIFAQSLLFPFLCVRKATKKTTAHCYVHTALGNIKVKHYETLWRKWTFLPPRSTVDCIGMHAQETNGTLKSMYFWESLFTQELITKMWSM